jgi:solute carrier family 25 phosphate transporter 3
LPVCHAELLEGNSPVSRRELLASWSVAAAAVVATTSAGFPSAAAAAAAAASSPSDTEMWRPLTTYDKAMRTGSQSTYSPRFTAYLARFLINFEPKSRAEWRSELGKVTVQGSQAFSRRLLSEGTRDVFDSMDLNGDGLLDSVEFSAGLSSDDASAAFARFQASVGFGLSKYQGKDGVRSLFKLLMQDFGGTLEGRRQIALLFSLMDVDQPVDLIKRLIADTDRGHVVEVKVVDRGSGYSPDLVPSVVVGSPALPAPAEGAKVSVTLAPTGSIFRVRVTSPGRGYDSPPSVVIAPPRAAGGRAATAVAVLKGDRIGSIVLTDPGQGYAVGDDLKVAIAAPAIQAAAGLPSATAPAIVQQVLDTASAEAQLDYGVASAQVTTEGFGYSSTLPVKVAIEPPPSGSMDKSLGGRPAKLEAVLTPPPEGEENVLRAWLPPAYLKEEVTQLLPSNLQPTLDPCLGKFYISPIERNDPNYCIYYENDEFQVYPSERLSPYFSFLDGPRTRYPVERERPLDASVYLRFAACGAACGSAAHMVLVPIDVVKTRMQSEPKKYPRMAGTFRRLWRDGGIDAFLLGAGATVVGYAVYGGVSFGVTELAKRKLGQLLGPEIAALYPVQLLLGASAIGASLAAVGVTPFESLRIRAVTEKGFPNSLAAGFAEVARKGELPQLFEGLPALLLAEVPYCMAKFGVFNAASKLAYLAFPQASESVALGLGVSLLSGMLAGVAASLVSQPGDTIMTYVTGGHGGATPAQEDEGDELELLVEDAAPVSVAVAPASREVVDIPTALRTLLADGGIGRLYQGSVPRAIKSALNIALQFFLYDALKRLVSVSPDDIKVFFDALSGIEIQAAEKSAATAAGLVGTSLVPTATSGLL